MMMASALADLRMSRPLVLAAGVAGMLVAATIGLWGYYGTAVFFEMVRAGWLACF
jgi:hypothetical protein